MPDKSNFANRRRQLIEAHSKLLGIPNERVEPGNGIFYRWTNPVVTPDHAPLQWRYDFCEESNPFLMQRIGVNATFNAGAIRFGDRFCLIVRVEGYDRKSFFAIAESSNGVDHFKFRELPIRLDQTEDPDTNVYDMRLTAHEDGYIYGLFCTERKDKNAGPGDTWSAIAQCGIVRTKDLESWERLPDLQTGSQQQRNVVLHPEFIDGKYGLYTRPQDGFIEVGSGGGIGWGLCESMEAARVDSETMVEDRKYHTIKELKNGQGPAPLKTDHGWLHLAHGVRNTAAGLRYVLYMFMTSLEEPWRVIAEPGGYFMAPENEERIGDVSNVLFCNGWIRHGKEIFIYYASSDTRTHVATTTEDQLLDYVLNTPPDALRSAASVESILNLAAKNRRLEKQGMPNE